MPTLLDYKRRIRSVRNTQQITRAMKFVAAARLRRAQEKVSAARPYAEAIRQVVRSAAARIETPVHPLLMRRAEERVLLLVLTGERGLCGAFNANVIRKAVEFLSERQGQTLEVIPLGKKGRDALRKQPWKILAEYIDITTRAELAQAKEVAERISQIYSAAETDAVYLLFNEFKSVLTQKLTIEKLLPIEPESLQEKAREGTPREGESPTQVDYLYEQPSPELFGRLLPLYVESLIYRSLAESSAAEHAARMTAMDSATNNAGELIDQLTLHMNKVRQAAITKEIIEVVSGASWAG